MGMRPDPLIDFSVRCAGGDKVAELILVDACRSEKFLIHRTAILVFSLPADQRGPALIEAAGGEFETAEFFRWGAGLLGPQIPGLLLNFVQSLVHRSSLGSV